MSSPSDGSRRPPWAHRRRLLKWSLGGLAALVILAALGVGLFRIAANLLPRYHARIQQQVSAQLGAPVRLGRISLRWHGLGPEIAVRDVRILSPSSRRAVITVRRLRLDFSLFAFIHGTAARPSRISADGLRMTLVRRRDGSLAVAGLPSSRGGGGGSLQAMLADGFSLTDSSVRLELAGAPAEVWEFSPITVEIGTGYEHSVDVSVQLPPVLGASRLQLLGTVATRGPDPGEWRWNIHFALERLRLQPLRRLLPDAVPPIGGTLAFDGTIQGTGAALSGGSGRFVATNLSARQSRIPALQARFGIGGGKGLSVALSDTRIVEADRVWKPGAVTLARDPSGRLHAGIEHVALAALPPLTGFLPEQAGALATRIVKMAPAGDVENLRLALTPGRANPDLKAELRDVSIQAALGAPGFEHLNAKVDIADGTGTVDLDSSGFALLMPHLFDHPVQLDRLRGALAVSLSDAGLRLATTDLSITGNGLSGALKGEIDVPRGAPVHIKLQASAAGIDLVVARAHYLPEGLLPRPLDEWLMHGLEGGKITGATLALDGSARQFPYAHGGGHFQTQFGFADVTLKPGPNWPPLRNLAGRVTFENAGMRAEVTGGSIEGAKVVQATTVIPDLFKVHLAVNAGVAGDARDFLAFLRASPAGTRLKRDLDRFRVQGATSTQLTLNLPIMHPARFSLRGQLKLASVHAGYAGAPVALDGLHGSVAYDRNGPLDGKLVGKVAGTPVTLRFARSAGDAKTRVSLNGVFPVPTVAKITGSDLTHYASGRLPLEVDLAVPLTGGGTPVTVDAYSDLRDLALNLPAPIGKEAGTRVETQAHLVIRGNSVSAEARYADVLNACAQIDTSKARPVVRGMDVVLGTGKCGVPASGLRITGGWQSLTLDPWLSELPRQGGGAGRGGAQLGSLTLDLHFGEIRAFAQVFKNEGISGTLAPTQMLLTLDGPDLAGRLSIPRHPTNGSPIVVELTRGQFAVPQKQGLIVAPANATAPAAASAPAPAAMPAATPAPAREAMAGKRVTPQDIPPFVVHAAHLEIGTAALNDVLVSARRVGDGIVLDPIKVGGGDLTLDGTLAWLRPPAGTNEGALRFTGKVAGLGRLLSGLGIGPVITGHGALSAALAWHEPPGGGAFAEQLLGRVSVDLRDGGISQVNPGAGRILSLLALANIPRYLVFNFNNLFGKGFPFSRIHGDYVIDKGVATTDGLVIDSSVAWIKLTGSINLPRETIDQKADIVPNYTGSLPIIGALFGGLPVGAAIFAVTKIFGGAIAQATKLQYSVTGPLANPLVKPLGGTPAPKAGTRPAPGKKQRAATGGGR